MRAHRKTLGTRAVAATLILLAVATMGIGLSREDVLEIALGLLLAAASMQVFQH